jgi:hypothetical protein
MKIKSISTILFLVIFLLSCSQQKKITFINQEAEKRIDVLVNGKLFTSYCWPDNVMKPILFPINTSAGTTITRGYPIKNRPFETTDHPHHNGEWLNYGDVNGYNFWGNTGQANRADTSAAARKRISKLGSIKHLKFESMTGGDGEGVLVCDESWILDATGKELMAEKTEYHFIAKGSNQIIDRITTLTAREDSVTFRDTKEGMFGMRVARQLEIPSKDKRTMTDAQGNPSPDAVVSTEGVTGDYRSSEGIKGDSVWSTRAKWMDLFGNIGEEKISVVICDHPKNVSYPTYWHARGYGLFCLNPFGARDFTKGKVVLNYTIPPGKSITLRYRTIVHSGSHLTDAEINALSDEFAGKYQ